MPTYPEEPENLESPFDDDERDAPQARDLSDADDDETPTVPCPSCRRRFRISWIGARIAATGSCSRPGRRPGTKLWFLLVVLVAVLLILWVWVLRR